MWNLPFLSVHQGGLASFGGDQLRLILSRQTAVLAIG
jgi:hypothetical protein